MTETLENRTKEIAGSEECKICLFKTISEQIDEHPEKKMLIYQNPCYNDCDGFKTECPGYRSK